MSSMALRTEQISVSLGLREFDMYVSSSILGFVMSLLDLVV